MNLVGALVEVAGALVNLVGALFCEVSSGFCQISLVIFVKSLGYGVARGQATSYPSQALL